MNKWKIENALRNFNAWMDTEWPMIWVCLIAVAGLVFSILRG